MNRSFVRRAALLALIVPVVAFIASCSSNSTGSQPSKTDLLTGTTWKLDAASVTAYVGIFQQIVSIPGVSLDYTAVANSVRYKYTADGKFTLTTSLGSYNGTWKFVNNETQIQETYPSPLDVYLNGTHDIVTLTSTQYNISFTLTPPTGGAAVKYNVNFVPAN